MEATECGQNLTASAMEDEAPRCRYCFEVATEDSPLISPCACKGHSAWTHQSCLIKWQRRQKRGISTCEVCQTPWTINLDALDRELFVHSVKTNNRYPPVDESGIPDEAAQEALIDMMQPGTLILQTPSRAEEARNLPRQMPPNSQSNTLSLFAFMLSLQRTKRALRSLAHPCVLAELCI